MVVVDSFSGWQFTRCLGKEATSQRVISEMRSIFCTTGTPEKIFSDGGPQFTSRAFQMFVGRWGVEHITSSPHYPQSNGTSGSGSKDSQQADQKMLDYHGRSGCRKVDSRCATAT